MLGAQLGRLTLVAIQGEPLAQIGMRIKEVLRRRGPAMVFGYFAEHNLYIPTRENVRLDLYQAQALRVQYTCPVGWSLDVEEEMLKVRLAHTRKRLGKRLVTGGRVLGEMEEWFLSQLSPGDTVRFVPVCDDCAVDGCEFCCTTCDAAVFLLEVVVNTATPRARVA